MQTFAAFLLLASSLGLPGSNAAWAEQEGLLKRALAGLSSDAAFHWTGDHVRAIAPSAAAAPVIQCIAKTLGEIDLWDHWPITDRAGRVVPFPGGPLMVALSAPVLPDPEARHGIARLRLLQMRKAGLHDLGLLLPDHLNPGSREWAGSTILEDDGHTTSLYFTAAGYRDEPVLGFAQRLMLTRGQLSIDSAGISIGGWSAPEEIVVPDGRIYQSDMAGGGAVGTIKAFRDPAPFIDPDTGLEHLVFSASQAGSASPWNGLIGCARRDGQDWHLLSPLVSAVGLNNELERPHIVHDDGKLMLFWSTQSKVFANGMPCGPTGLYGAVADRLAGPWRPLNGTGLVLANPANAPAQAYSWLVLDDLSVWSFVDRLRVSDGLEDNAAKGRAFGGTPAPVLKLVRKGEDQIGLNDE